MYAHIYKNRNGGYKLIITTGNAISIGVLSERIYVTKTSAKQAAKEAGAKPLNY
jgi:uncharacterized protein YegP (UPF0339 family)